MSQDDRYFMRRVVSWVAYHVRKGADLAGVLAANAKRKPSFPEEQIREAYSAACDACRNVELIRGAPADMRICDIPGLKLPKG